MELFAGLVEEITTDPALRGSTRSIRTGYSISSGYAGPEKPLAAAARKTWGRRVRSATPEEADQLPLRPQNLRGHISELLSSGSAAFWGTVKR